MISLAVILTKDWYVHHTYDFRVCHIIIDWIYCYLYILLFYRWVSNNKFQHDVHRLSYQLSVQFNFPDKLRNANGYLIGNRKSWLYIFTPNFIEDFVFNHTEVQVSCINEEFLKMKKLLNVKNIVKMTSSLKWRLNKE